MHLPLAAVAAAAGAALALPIAAPAAAQAPTTRLAGVADLWSVQGDVPLGRPTAYVTFRTADAATARDLVVQVSGTSGRTYTHREGRPGARRAFRAIFRPYQRDPEPRRLKPGVVYEVRFFSRASGGRELMATRRLPARAFRPAGARIGRGAVPVPR